MKHKYRVGQDLAILAGNQTIMNVTITKLVNGKPLGYELEGGRGGFPMYLSEPVLEKILSMTVENLMSKAS